MITEVVESCENCNRSHNFDRNKQIGKCNHINQGITRNSKCRFYIRDSVAFKCQCATLIESNNEHDKENVAS